MAVPPRPPVRTFLLALLAVLILSAPTRAQPVDTMCDPSFQDCRTPLLNYVRRETHMIDVAMWFMEDQELADAIVARFRAGVEVRRSEEHTSELQSQSNLVCRLLLE